AGVRETVAMELSGHKTPSVFRRYAISGSADRRAAMEITEASLMVDPHNPAIYPHSPTNGHNVSA
ncbi:MAG TPA: hypothetical protein VLG10_01700, partial [Methylomirabilota bacterium]|nr:hypothetical protein [Methylomirabilota bacterium]